MPVVNIRDGDGNIKQVLSLNLSGAGATLNECLDGSISGAYTNNAITSLRMGAFAECKNLTSIDLPNCTTMKGSRHFYNCTGLTTVNLSNVTTVDDLGYAFCGAKNLTSVSFPKLANTNVPADAASFGACFDGCVGLTSVYFDTLSGVKFGNFAFRGCSALQKIVIGGKNFCPLNSSNVFSNIPKTCILYVDESLVSKYESDTNWNQFPGTISKIPSEGVPR